MKDRALELAAKASDREQARHSLREYLQHVVLRELFEAGALSELVFHGGTALRMLHRLPRFSEDLDFHLAKDAPTTTGLRRWMPSVTRGLRKAGYDVRTRDRLETTVQSSFVKFRRLLFEADLSPHPDENLQVKLEVDTRPPEGSRIETSFLATHFPLSLLHHDRGTFLAGKLHALLERRYAKGRDFFDLLFYLERWREVEPNLVYLRNALAQTGYTGPDVTESSWRSVVAARVEQAPWTVVEADVRRFLERPSDRRALRKDHLLALLARR